MKSTLRNIAIFLLVFFAIFSCNPTSKEQNLRGFYGRVNCLDVKETERINKIKIGNGKLIFNKDKTFIVTNDSVKYSNIKGIWDLCCSGSDYGNFVFTVDGYKPYESSIPSFYITIGGKEIKLVFTICE